MSTVKPSESTVTPQPAYLPGPDSILHPPTELYSRIAETASNTSARTTVTEFTIPPRSGLAWKVPAGGIFRLSTPQGPQVGGP